MSNIIVRIDSIYGLALSKLLLDTGEVSLSNPNREILENLSINEEKHPHDVNISDLDNRTGIMLKGYPLAVKKIEKLFREELLDSIIFQHPVKQDAIYSAMVIKRIFKKRLSILDLGGDTRGIIFNSSAEVGEQIIVQVKELPTEIDKLPVCSTEITLGGDYVILEVEQDFVRVSRKLQGAEREALHNLGKLHQPPGFGIIIRTSAASANEDDIIKEINSLVDLWSEIHRQMEEDERGIKLVSGEMVSEVYFANASKQHLDTLRAKILPTLPNYHHLRSYSMATGFGLEFIQTFIAKIPMEEASKRMLEMILERDYTNNRNIRGDFRFLNGTIREENLGNIIDNKIMKTSFVKHENSSDPNEYFKLFDGNRVEAIFAAGGWTIHYKYYNNENLTGERLRIITPLDLGFKGRIRAFDMGMNLYKDAETGRVDTQVDDITSNMIESGMISKDLDEKLGDILRNALELLNASHEQIIIK